MAYIQYEDKEQLNRLDDIPQKNKVVAEDMNEIKRVVNENADALNDIITREQIMDEVFPIGKIEVFFDNDDHSNYCGLNWVRISQGQFPVGISSQTDFNQIGKTGGALTHKHTNPSTGYHTLTIDEIPEHTHKAYDALSGSSENRHVLISPSSWVPAKTPATIGSIIGYTGGNDSHNHPMGSTKTASSLPPYIVMAFWKRES